MKDGNVNRQAIDKLAEDILGLSKDSLITGFRFLDAAINQLLPIRSPVDYPATDGRFLFYDSAYIIKAFKRDNQGVTRDYMHILLHCIFHHPFISSLVDRELWDLACDISAENAINEFDMEIFHSHRINGQEEFLREIKKDVKLMTAEKIYHYLMNTEISDEKKESMGLAFKADDHFPWYNLLDEQYDTEYESSGQNEEEAPEAESNKNSGSEESESKSQEASQSEGDEFADEKSQLKGEYSQDTPDSKSAEVNLKKESEKESEKTGEDKPDGDHENHKYGDKEGLDSFSGEGADEAANGEKESGDGKIDRKTGKQETKDIWKQISQRAEVCLETLSKEWGDKASAVIQNLKPVNYEPYDYKKFLERFSELGENIHVNDDEFDYIFYTYGLKLYKNMPLIEPLEYKEDKRIKEFVIAIDTSGSCAGEVVQAFIQKTYNILMQGENFFTKVNIHIIQCDQCIQEDYKIQSADDFQAYIKNVKLKGFGGTDFRPVFALVDKMVEEKEFVNLKGLIYFTDGYGEFPKYKPNYDTAFIFLDDEMSNPEVPVWAMKLVLDKNDL